MPRETEPEEENQSDERKKGGPESLEKALEDSRQRAEEYLNSWKRTQADFANFKRRSEQEKLEMSRYAAAQLILNLLPVLDDFERAFASTDTDANHDWVAGVKLIENKLRSVLDAQGLKQIEALDQPFDPALHEGVMHSKGPEGIVVQELRKGYKLAEKVLRPSQVVVGNGEEE